MFSLNRTETFSQDIKKSCFRATAAAVADEAEVRAFLTAQSEPSANHNCWAWRIGQAFRFSDDGEPSGTAGRPILQAIDGQELDRVAVVVTRWFGGILLGSGGLVRAYGGAAAACLSQAEKTAIVPSVAVRIACVFSDLARVKARLLALPDVTAEGETFTETGAELSFRLPAEQAERILRTVADMTSGRARVSI
ncbi:IMPACT family protein [Rhizobiaceae bacterium BDR2-2]|uniref:IMPACT family protein n=1 Tax=Ectorhizobium quercum TaxID=2965071 RepID=A0AAE3SVQ3_9HYPH|nr:YigZ family protein [Ectorhizobium quercum]MCX8997224.1 IMPACT family protein [Ectorhizobium quercum]